MAKRKVVVSEEDIDRDGIDTSPSNFNDLLIDKLKSDLGGNVYILGRDHTPADVKEYLSTGSTVLDMCVTNNLEVKGDTNTFIVDDIIASGLVEKVEDKIVNINEI